MKDSDPPDQDDGLVFPKTTREDLIKRCLEESGNLEEKFERKFTNLITGITIVHEFKTK